MARNVCWIGCAFLLLAACNARRVRTYSDEKVRYADAWQMLQEDTSRFRQSDSCRERLSVCREEIMLSVPDSSGRQHVRSVRRMTSGRQTESGRQTDLWKRERSEAVVLRLEHIQEQEETVRETDAVVPFPGLRIFGWVSALMIALFVWRKFSRSG